MILWKAPQGIPIMINSPRVSQLSLVSKSPQQHWDLQNMQKRVITAYSPQKISPTINTLILGAKKRMKMKAFIMMRLMIVVFL